MMKLFEMKALPKKAGLANLHFGLEGSTRHVPFRKDEDIILPNHCVTEFFPLMDGEQFLLCDSAESNTGTIYTNGYWFGGTDERPFLVRLTEKPFRAFQKGGEKGFFTALKPEIVLKFEERFQVIARRQGDIFAVPVPYAWDEIRRARLLCFNEDAVQEPKNVKAQPLFETRHKLKGLYAGSLHIFGNNHTLVEGTLEAPDHEPLELNRIHLIFQTQNLYDPRLAD